MLPVNELNDNLFCEIYRSKEKGVWTTQRQRECRVQAKVKKTIVREKKSRQFLAPNPTSG